MWLVNIIIKYSVIINPVHQYKNSKACLKMFDKLNYDLNPPPTKVGIFLIQSVHSFNFPNIFMSAFIFDDRFHPLG